MRNPTATARRRPIERSLADREPPGLLREVRLLVLGVLVMSSGSLLLSGPLILPDESSFIIGAYNAIGDLGPSGFGYHPGYSFLLVPVAAVADDITVFYRLTQVVNVLLSLATALLARALILALRPTMSSAAATRLAMVIAAYPAFRVFAAMALSENILIPATLAVSLGVVRVVGSNEPRGRNLFILGAASGLVLVVHARAIVVPIAVVVAVVIAWRERPSLVARVIVGTVLGVAVAFGVVQAQLPVNGLVETGSDSRLTLGGILRANLTPSALYTLPFTALGQLFYLTIASFGLLPLAARTLFTEIKSGESRLASPTATLGLFLLPLFVGSLAVSALFLNEQTGDQAIYGRYMEGISAAVLVVGAVGLIGASDDVSRFLFRVAAALPVLALTLIAARGIDTFNGRQQLVNITGVYPVVRLTGALTLSSLTIAGVVAVGTLAFLRRNRPSQALVYLFVAFVVVAAFDLQQAGAAQRRLAESTRVGDVAAEMAASNNIDCVAIDQEDLDEVWQAENYRLIHLGLDFEHWSSRSGEPPCSDLVVSARTDLHRELAGSAVIEVEPGWPPILWVLDGDLQERLIAQDVALGDRPFQVLHSDSSFAMRIELVDEDGSIETDETEYAAGEEVRGRLYLTNLGAQELVPSAGVDRSGGANIGLEWRDGRNPESRLAEPLRMKGFDEVLFTGDSIVVDFVFKVESRGEELEPGPYLLRTEIVLEGVQWTGFAATAPITVIAPTGND